MSYSTEKEAKRGIRSYFTIGLTAFLVIAAAVIFFFLLFRLDSVSAFFHRLVSILQPIIIGFVIAYLLSPVMSFFERNLIKTYLSGKKKGKAPELTKRVTSTIRYLSIFLSLIVAGILIYILGNLIIPQLYVSILGIIRDWPNIQRRIDAFTTWINTTRDNNQTIATYANEGIVRVKDYFENWVETDLLSKMNTWFNYFATGVLGFITVVKNLLIGIIVSIYVLLEKEHFAAQGKMIIYALFKTRPANVIIETLRESNRIFGGFIMGKIIDSMIIGLLCFIGLSILKMPYTLLVSVIVGVTNVIPFFGPYFGAIPSALLILFIDPMKCLYFLIFIIILQQIDGNIIGPAIIGDSTGLSAFWVIFSILGGGGLFGLVGMLIGVPTFAVIYYIIRTYIEYRLTSKELKSASQDYEDLDRINKENGITVYKHLSS